MRVLTISIIILFLLNEVHAQSYDYYGKPLDIPLFLSGTFGELRSDHFHSGIDLRTQGVTGKRVFAVADGYVSRIRIQPAGYGKSLYIDHPEGTTSVYGHLDEFNPLIAGYIKDLQYLRQSHSIEIFPNANKFPVKKGDLIAYSGNTGSSGGPHLHFEIRRTKGQIPLNVLQYANFNIIDKTRPGLTSFSVYPADTTSQVNSGNIPVYLPVESVNPGRYKIAGNRAIKISGKVGFGIEAYDYLDGSSNRCGPYSIELRAGGRTVFHFTADQFSFDETRYINAFIDYPALKISKKRINLLYRKPNNHLSMYKSLINDGILEFMEGEKAELEIIVKDLAGNESVLGVLIEGVTKNPLVQFNIPEYTSRFRWNGINHYASHQFEIMVPQGALYEDIYFRYSSDETRDKFYPFLHYIHDSIAPLHRPARITLMAEMIPAELRDKTVMVKICGGKVRTGRSGTWSGSSISANISEFGVYSLDVDTISPTLRPLNISPGKSMRNETSIRFYLDDNLSGVSSYEGSINDEWALFEYDPKNKLLFYVFDKERLQGGKTHKLKVYAEDMVGNKAVYRAEFEW